MRAKSILFLVVAAALVGFGLAFRDHAARRAAEAAAAQSLSRRDELEAKVRDSERRLLAAENERRQAQAAIDEARGKAAMATGDPARRSAPAEAPMSAVRHALLNDPQLQNLQLAAMQARQQATYGPLCEHLRLSETQIAQFFANLRKREEQEMDISAIQETQHMSGADPVLAKMRQQMSDDFRAAQRALLGEDGFRDYESYSRSIPAREFVNELAGASVILGAGITAAQADTLTEMMANASAAYRHGGTATRNSGDIDWDQVLAGAAGVLSQPQFTVLKNAVIQARNMERIRQLARRK